MNQFLAKTGLGNRLCAAAFGRVFPQQDLPDPGIHGEGVDMMKAEQADTVGHFFTDTVKALEIVHGFLIAQTG